MVTSGINRISGISRVKHSSTCTGLQQHQDAN